MNQRIFGNVVLILMGVIIIVGGVGCFAPPQAQVPQSKNTNVYQSEAYGFYVEYPKTWKVIEATIKGVPWQSTWAGNVLQREEIHKVTFLEKEDGSWAGFAVRVLPNSENLSVKQWREAQLQKSDAEQTKCRK